MERRIKTEVRKVQPKKPKKISFVEPFDERFHAEVEVRMQEINRAQELRATLPIVSVRVKHCPHVANYGEKRGFRTLKHSCLEVFVTVQGFGREEFLWLFGELGASRIEQKIKITQDFLIRSVIGLTIKEARTKLGGIRSFTDLRKAVEGH